MSTRYARRRTSRSTVCSIAYRVDGSESADALVLVNSLGSDLRMWDPQVESLARHFRVIRYDCRGHGESDVPAGPTTIGRLGADLIALLDHLNVERAHLCGLSLGGLTALWVAAHHPMRVESRRVRQYGGTPRDDAIVGRAHACRTRRRHGGDSRHRRRAVSRRAVPRGSTPTWRRRIGDMVEATPAAGYLAACAALRDADLRDVVASIRAPSLIVAGELDESAPVRQSRGAARRDRGQRAGRACRRGAPHERGAGGRVHSKCG